MDVRIESIQFCRRSTTTIDNTTISNGEQWTFNRLRKMNVSANQLFDWYAPMDVIEEYILGKEIGLFVNCSQKGNFWFGARCQYTFNSSNDFESLMWDRFDAKDYFQSNILSITNGTCYPTPDGECQSVLCLDWREICDGKIDCANGLDERHCSKLEMNKCDQATEYRCLNGQCIDKAFYRDQYPDCMDYSDEKLISSYECFYKFDGRCEDRPCHPMWFSCGDGHCYDGPNIGHKESCGSQRDRLYFNRMPPSTLILFSHLSVVYSDTKPELMCYNESVCPYLSKEDHFVTKIRSFDGSTCRLFNALNNRTYSTVPEMIQDVKRFVRSCSLLADIEESHRCSMFHCDDGSKCLFQHRVLDGHEDCSDGEDERQNDTCLFGHPYRFRCDEGTRCIHPSLVGNKIRECADGSDEIQAMANICFDEYVDECRAFRRESRRFNVTFRQLCNGIVERHSDLDNHTDESDCRLDEWPCRTLYTTCNAIWNCPNGQDELGCGRPNLASYHCNHTTHFCLDIETGLPICLTQSRANDGIIDCVGSTDERSFCRLKYPNETVRRYRCLDSDQCISPLQVCDCHSDCSLNDDETIACVWLNDGKEPFCDSTRFRCRNGKHFEQKFRCNGLSSRCVDGEEKLFCDLIDQTFTETISLTNLEEYPYLTNNRTPRSLFTLTDSIVWSCNRGLYVHSIDHSDGFFCLCSNYYYGDRCQFQRKRVTFLFQVQITGSFDRSFPIFKFVVLFIRKTNTTTILTHDQLLYTPLHYCSPKYFVHLLYPINEPLLSSSNDFVYIHMFNATTLEHRASWEFPVPFHFLPVQRMAKQLFVSDTDAMFKSTLNTSCRSCSTDALCLGHDIDLSRDICVCPLYRIGHRCLISFDPCTNDSCNGHGDCVPSDARFHADSQWMCFCHDQWFGDRCENPKSRIHVSFDPNVVVSPSSIALIHVIIPQSYREPSRFTYFRRLSHEVSNLTIFFNLTTNTGTNNGFVAVIQLYEDRHHFDYYLLAVRTSDSQPLTDINTKIHPSGRCRPIDKLFNRSVLAQPQLRRVKNYQRPCLQRNPNRQLRCFYDDELMCLCDKTNHANCFNLEYIPPRCPWSKCSNRGTCVQDNELCPTSSLCLCEPCSFGSICQFSTAGYVLSIDAILGSHIRPRAISLLHQTKVVKITVSILSLLLVFGGIFDLLAIRTFSQKIVREVGCGFYLFVSSILGLLTMIALMCKMIVLLNTEQSNISCALIEFLLKWWPISCEWLNACVAVERALAVIYRTHFSRSKSKSVSKWVVMSVLLFVGMICSLELVFRRMVVDNQDERVWCVLTINPDRPTLQTLYTVSNIFLLGLPLIINLISGAVIVLGNFHRKEEITLNTVSSSTNINNRNRMRKRLGALRQQILKHKHILIGPVLLALLSLSRLIFTFIFVCTKLDQRPFLNLFGYLLGFLPSMAVLFVFVLPSQLYRTALFLIVKQIVPRCMEHLFLFRNHSV